MLPGLIFIIAAPSGAGKTSLVKALLEKEPRLAVAVSHTTRAQRPAEEPGQHYHFITDETFIEYRDRGDFVEHAQVFDYHYATSKAAILQPLEQGKDVLLDIDWQGAEQIRKNFPTSQVTSIFLLPPSKMALRERLLNRGQDDYETINRRMTKAQDEMSHYNEFDYLLINDDFAQTLEQLYQIIETAHFRRERQAQLQKNLLQELLH